MLVTMLVTALRPNLSLRCKSIPLDNGHSFLLIIPYFSAAPSKDKGKGVARPEIINAHGQEDTRTRKDNGQGDAHAQEDAHTPEDAPEDAPTPEDQLPCVLIAVCCMDVR